MMRMGIISRCGGGTQFVKTIILITTTVFVLFPICLTYFRENKFSSSQNSSNLILTFSVSLGGCTSTGKYQQTATKNGLLWRKSSQEHPASTSAKLKPWRSSWPRRLPRFSLLWEYLRHTLWLWTQNIIKRTEPAKGERGRQRLVLGAAAPPQQQWSVAVDGSREYVRGNKNQPCRPPWIAVNYTWPAQQQRKRRRNTELRHGRLLGPIN